MGIFDDLTRAFSSLFDKYDSRLDEIDHRLDCLADSMRNVEHKSAPKPAEKWPPFKGHKAEVETVLLGKRVKICDGSYAVGFKPGNHFNYERGPEYRESWEVVAEKCKLPTANDHHQSAGYSLDNEPFNDIILRSDDGLIVFSQARFVKVV